MNDITERPIGMTGLEVRAILAGHKTQARIPINGTKPDIGERLWVQEDWQSLRFSSDPDYPHIFNSAEVVSHEMVGVVPHTSFVYEADGHWDKHRDDRGFVWRYRSKMPRRASRILLEITDLRVERVQDITEDDAKAECPPQHENWPEDYYVFWREAFKFLWMSKYGPDLWAANPLVWAISFRVVPTHNPSAQEAQ